MPKASASDTPSFERLRVRLAGLRRQLRWYYFCNGLNWLIAVGAGAAILLGVFAVLLDAPPSILTALAVAAGLTVLATAVRHLVYPLSRRISDQDLVVLIEREYPWLKDRLISTLQLAKYRGPADYSPKMVEALAREVEQVVAGQDFADVLKPNRLVPMGLTAVVMSLLLAGTSFALSVYQPPRSQIVLRIVEPHAAADLPPDERVPTDVLLNFIHDDPRRNGATGVAHRLVVARGSDLVIDGLPAVQGRNANELNLREYASAQVVLGGREARDMQARGAQGRRPFYRYVMQDVREDRTLTVRWRDVETQAIRIEVTDPPRITDSRIVYRAPARMRPRQVPKEPGLPDSIPVRIQSNEDGHIEVTIPRVDRLPTGVALSTVWAQHSDVVTFESDEAFAAAYPHWFSLYVRERVDETRDQVAGTEDMLVAFQFTTNRPIDPRRSHLGIRLRPTARAGDTRELQTVAFEPMDADGREWQARFRLEQAMHRYYVRLFDERGLHQGALNEFDVNVVPDRPPIARFRDTGVPLIEGRNERFVTPGGYLPIVVGAEDDFGLRGLSLEFRRRDEPDTAWRAVPGFDAAAHLRDFPRSVEVPVDLRMSRLLPNLTLADDSQVDLVFRVVAEDVKVDPTQGQGQVGISAPFELTVVTPVRMRAEIRFLMRNVLMRQVEDALRKQRGLELATLRFLPRGGDEVSPRATLAEGMPLSDVFIWEERRGEATRSRRLTGADALRVQDEIARTSAAVARRLDAVVRHYIYNDLEDDRDLPQENRLQEAKILLALVSMEKEAALDMNEQLRRLRDAENVRQREDEMREVLRRLLRGPSGPGGLLPVRARFDRVAFADTLRTLEFWTAGSAREASFQYEQALSAGGSRRAEADALRRAHRHQQTTERVLGEVLDRLSRWEGLDEYAQRLRQLYALQQELRDALREEAMRE